MRTAPQKFSVCEHGADYAQAEVAKAIDILRKVSPSGVTPLTQHIWDVEDHISEMADDLRRSGRIVAIILATDGMYVLILQNLPRKSDMTCLNPK
jgi:hypothetical protein